MRERGKSYVVQRKATQGTLAEHYAGPAKRLRISGQHTGNHRAQFTPARDSRNRRVPGLYIRNGRFYCQLSVDRGDGRKTARRFPLFNPENLRARTLNEAKEALEIKRNDRREDKLPTPGRKPNFLDYSEMYLNKAKVQRKRPGTLQNEQQSIARWRSHLGHIRGVVGFGQPLGDGLSVVDGKRMVALTERLLNFVQR